MSRTNANPKVKVVYGAFPIGRLPEEDAKEIFNVLKENGIDEIDTARAYEGSEKVIGEAGWSSEFIVDTKAPRTVQDRETEEVLSASIEESLSLLKLPSVNIFYLHFPDPDTPFEEVLKGINDLYKQGKFKKFGISNFSATQVREVYDIAKKNGYVLPTVYQGNYNAFTRTSEEDLLPLLRELGISFYAYSPVAGGFLTKTSEEILGNKSERFNKDTPTGAFYHALYVSEPLLKGLDQFGEIAKKNNIDKFELAFRWIFHNSRLDSSKGDGVVIGGRNADQVKKTLVAIKKGPLHEEVVSEIDGIWNNIKGLVPTDAWEILRKLLTK
ncbi:hypothetical protein KDRO_B07470 [Kluyveromyces lactis]|nr:hypothetical protein KDRO_B07470 [Kluyveromyces lactis]